MNNFKYIFFLLLLSVMISASGQQRVQFSQYMVNQYVLNPAAAGIGSDLDITASYRKQWVDVQGGPVTYYLTANAPIRPNKKPKANERPSGFHSVGINSFNDQTGPLSKLTFMGSYSYNLPVSGDYRLAIGLFAGFTSIRLDQSQLEFDQEGETFNYPSLTVPDGSFGFWFYNTDFFLGSSVNQVFHNNISFVSDNDVGNLALHYYLTSGYKIALGTPSYENRLPRNYLVPSIMLKYGGMGTWPSMDLNVKFHFLENFWVGTSHRMLDSQALLAGYRFYTGNSGFLELSYSYDYTLSAINPYTLGSHEIIVKFSYEPKDLVCPSTFW